MNEKLAEAVRLHQTGNREAASRIYAAILEQDPNNADALHLQGVISLEHGRSGDAVNLIRRAIAISPQAAAYHANLAEAFRRQGQINAALQSGEMAIRLQPGMAEAHNNLALCLRAQGRNQEAIEHLKKAIEAQPDFAMAYNNLGDAMRSVGEYDEALAMLQKAVALQPDQPEPRTNLGQMLLERQQYDDALEHCREAVRLRPNLPEAHNNLGNVHRELRQLNEARACYRRALELNRELGVTYANMGRTFQAEGNYDEARKWYEQALARTPTSGIIYAHLGSMAQSQERFREAEEKYRLSLQFEPNQPAAWNSLGYILHQLGEDQESEECLLKALELNPNLVGAHVNLGDLYEEQGKFKEAEEAFRTALKLNPSHGGAMGQLATMLRKTLPEEDINRMREFVSRPDAVVGRRVNLLHGLAHALDARKDYDEAAKLLEEGNAMRLKEWQDSGKGYVPEDHTLFIDNMKKTFTPEFFESVKGLGLSTLKPVFVVGLPRSGTTLTEQILAKHSQIYGAGELRLARDGFDRLPATRGGTGHTFQHLPGVDRKTVARCAQQHLDALQLHDPDAARIVDKMPDNYLYLGWLAMIFPKSRFIHIKRDPRDIAVSCWMTNFKQIRWACSKDHIANRFAEYQRVMDHWREVLPVPLLEIEYEEVVSDFENTAKKLVEWTGVEWEPECLEFYKSDGPIRTASVSQVRQPLYKRSVARWKNYEEPLGDLFAQITPDNK